MPKKDIYTDDPLILGDGGNLLDNQDLVDDVLVAKTLDTTGASILKRVSASQVQHTSERVDALNTKKGENRADSIVRSLAFFGPLMSWQTDGGGNLLLVGGTPLFTQAAGIASGEKNSTGKSRTVVLRSSGIVDAEEDQNLLTSGYVTDYTDKTLTTSGIVQQVFDLSAVSSGLVSSSDDELLLVSSGTVLAEAKTTPTFLTGGAVQIQDNEITLTSSGTVMIDDFAHHVLSRGWVQVADVETVVATSGVTIVVTTQSVVSSAVVSAESELSAVSSGIIQVGDYDLLTPTSAVVAETRFTLVGCGGLVVFELSIPTSAVVAETRDTSLDCSGLVV